MLRTILIVDDEIDSRDILANILGKEYNVVCASSGREALNILAQNSAVISAILLDLMMPGMSGYEVIEALRAEPATQYIPVIVLTALSDPDAEEKAVSLGAYGFITKPYKSVLVKHHLKNAISFKETAMLQNLVKRDELTKIFNSKGFNEQAAVMIKNRPSGYYVLSCYDIDSFKVINDQYGVKTGDTVLKHIASVINETIAPLGGICCRVSEDGFAALYPTDNLGSDIIRERHKTMISPACLDRTLNVRTGRYIVEDTSLTVAAMYDRAVLAMESIKGRYNVWEATFDDSMRERILKEQEIVSEMNDALLSNQFEVWYQPQYNHATGALIGAEALVRWRHPQKGLIPPCDFISIFERNGFIYSLDKYVWEQVCRNLRKWIDQGRNPMPVSVNISREDVSNADIIDVLTGLLNKYNLDISLLRLEITETAFAGSTNLVSNVVKKFIGQGFVVEIDDFGSGYSSLNTLKDVPAQIIKLDMRFLERCEDSKRGGNIVESIVRMAKWLDMAVIAEGVETKKQADFLRSIGCFYVQGYLYAKPMPTAEYEAFCRGNNKEGQLITLETVDNLDNNSFWDPDSMDTLIFNSYIGAACIFEFHDGNIELLRAAEKYTQIFESTAMTTEDALKLKWKDHLDKENGKQVIKAIDESILTQKEVTGEYVFLDLPGCPHETFLRSTIRVIASAGDHYLVYCTNENITAQRIAEREKETAYKQVHNMMNDMPGGFIRMRVEDNGKISLDYVNDGFIELISTTRKRIVELCADDAFAGVHPDDVASIKASLADMLKTGKPRSCRHRMKRADGSYIWLSVLGRATEDATGKKYFNIYYTDASNQVKEEETQKALLDNLPLGAGIYEVMDGKLTLIYRNKSLCELIGQSEEMSSESKPMSVIHPDDVSIIRRDFYSAIDQGRNLTCTIRLKHSELGYRPTQLIGRIVRKNNGVFMLYATYSLIEPSGVTYQQMLPVILSAIMDSTSDVSFAKSKELRYLACSQMFLKVVGLENEQDVIGKTDYDLFDKETADNFRQSDERLLKSRQPIIDMTEVIPSGNGTQRYINTSKYLLRNSDGDVIGVYGVGHDITKSIEQESQLRVFNNNIPGGLVTYGFTGEKLRILYCNEGFCRLFGGTLAGMKKRDDFDAFKWINEIEKAELVSKMTALVQNNTPIDFVFRICVIGGGYKWVNMKANTVERRIGISLVHAVLLDITEHQNALEQLRMVEDENSLATALGGSIILRYNIANKTISIAPEIAAAKAIPEIIYDVPDEPVRNGHISPESVEAFSGFFKSIQNGKQNASALFQYRHCEVWHWIEAKSATIFNDDGKPIKAVISLMDVTERIDKESFYRKWRQSLNNRKPESYSLYRCNLNKDASYDTYEGGLLTFNSAGVGLNFNERAAVYTENCIYIDDRDEYLALMNTDTLIANYYRGNRSVLLEYRELLADGNYRWIRLTVDLVESLNSSDVEAYLMYEDIHEEKTRELITQALSENDSLTGILNRNTFIERVNKRLHTSKVGEIHALLMLDLDLFKRVNDVFGHAEGDKALVEIATKLRTVIRRNDLLARIGGDEFVLFMENIRDKQAAEAKAKQICNSIQRSYSVEVCITGSIGITLAPNDGNDFATLYKKADAALYSVKGSGKNGYAYYNESMADEHLRMEPDTYLADGVTRAEKKRRMLIVDDNAIDYEILRKIFDDQFIVDTAKDGKTALARLANFGSAISVVLLDLVMPVMDGFEVLKEMKETPELSEIPVIIVSGDESRETCLEAIRKGAADFITKPVDPDLMRIRVASAVSKAENERLILRNRMLEVQQGEKVLYESVLDCTGVTFAEYNRLTGLFFYYPSLSRYLFGDYNNRPLWQILLSDDVADENTVNEIRLLIQHATDDGAIKEKSIIAKLKTPDLSIHSFRVSVRRLINEHIVTDKVIIALNDLDYEEQHE